MRGAARRRRRRRRRRAAPSKPRRARASPAPLPLPPPLASPRASSPPSTTPQALVDGPENITGVRREVIALKWLALTDIKVGAARNARAKSLTAAWEKEGALAKWTGSAWAKKIAAKAAKAASTDFDRFLEKDKKQKVRAQVAKKLLRA